MTALIASATNTSTSRRTAWLVLGQTVERSVQILVALLLVKFLAPSEWNSVALALTVYLAAVTIGSFNLEHSILYFLPTLSPEQSEKLFARTARSLAVVGSLLGIVILIGSRTLGIVNSTQWGFFVAITVAAEMPTVIAGPALIARGREKDAGMWDSLLGLTQLSFLVVPALFSWGAQGVMYGLAAAGLVRLCAFLMIFGGDVLQHRGVADKQLFRRQLMYCAPLGVALATGVLTRTVDKWLVAWKIPTRVGIYAIAAQEVPILAVLPYASGAVIAGAMVRHFMAGNHRASFEVWVQQVRAMCRPVIALTFAVVVIAPEIFDITLAPTYQKSVLSFQIFTIIGLHRVTEYGAVLRAVGRTKEIVLSSVVLFALNTLFAGAGLYLHGIVGLTIGSVIAFGVAWIWMLSRLADVFHLTIATVFPWSWWCGLVAYFAAVSLAAHFAATEVSYSYTKVIVKVTILGAAYLASRSFVAESIHSEINEEEKDNVS